ncbi:hypothetical protein PAPYR_7450 [Paratrimastix pyriformis]|uniref:Uncharacterized protein n=1 Tax=Paratrimastix pyriformis TaxID=342808 RepID=A0ABQ8UH08_9EUKA|nr:hypothetical protein PAPYR_7450 [Paratrimastix pyriformis]
MGAKATTETRPKKIAALTTVRFWLFPEESSGLTSAFPRVFAGVLSAVSGFCCVFSILERFCRSPFKFFNQSTLWDLLRVIILFYASTGFIACPFYCIATGPPCRLSVPVSVHNPIITFIFSSFLIREVGAAPHFLNCQGLGALLVSRGFFGAGLLITPEPSFGDHLPVLGIAITGMPIAHHPHPRWSPPHLVLAPRCPAPRARHPAPHWGTPGGWSKMGDFLYPFRRLRNPESFSPLFRAYFCLLPFSLCPNIQNSHFRRQLALSFVIGFRITKTLEPPRHFLPNFPCNDSTVLPPSTHFSKLNPTQPCLPLFSTIITPTAHGAFPVPLTPSFQKFARQNLKVPDSNTAISRTTASIFPFTIALRIISNPVSTPSLFGIPDPYGITITHLMALGFFSLSAILEIRTREQSLPRFEKFKILTGLRPPFSRFEGAGKEISLGVRPSSCPTRDHTRHRWSISGLDREAARVLRRGAQTPSGPSEFAPVPYRGVVLRVSVITRPTSWPMPPSARSLEAPLTSVPGGSPATPPAPPGWPGPRLPCQLFRTPCSIVTTLSGFVKGAICH